MRVLIWFLAIASLAFLGGALISSDLGHSLRRYSAGEPDTIGQGPGIHDPYVDLRDARPAPYEIYQAPENLPGDASDGEMNAAGSHELPDWLFPSPADGSAPAPTAPYAQAPRPERSESRSGATSPTLDDAARRAQKAAQAVRDAENALN
ncbi:hypothetical protein [Novosphingobium mangrovi (ex Hu et al. 2023)]|uniref:Uncharacterized protein n=1 Tax=Novosphingobium mangrovi (ex Hu et al. 2023) TaxID=2930094 RepID=A0ABT0AC47_9SPHN|nr:hypothetical protein [Novosphingobium mangrovi (ex Hu et al. 2023)]MCJ1960771.1 hypothetical protein [Novosphingobium mangrovi (ex Hu et al. 2023)]